MATLRIRFGGLCLFQFNQNNQVVVRVLKATGHKPQLWLDPATGTVETARRPFPKPKDICTLESINLIPVQRQVLKFNLSGKEKISFGNGDGSGPAQLPGVAKLGRFNGNGGTNANADFAAEITLNKGRWDPVVPKRPVTWNNANLTEVLPLWTDLIITTEGDFFDLLSGINGQPGDGWRFKPFTTTGEVRAWVLSHGPGHRKKALHFHHLFDQLLKPPTPRPWPELQEGLPDCQSLARPRVVSGSAFCPDGQYP